VGGGGLRGSILSGRMAGGGIDLSRSLRDVIPDPGVPGVIPRGAGVIPRGAGVIPRGAGVIPRDIGG